MPAFQAMQRNGCEVKEPGYVPRLLTNMRPVPVPMPKTRNNSQKFSEAAHSHSFSSCFCTAAPASLTGALLACLGPTSTPCASSRLDYRVPATKIPSASRATGGHKRSLTIVLASPSQIRKESSEPQIHVHFLSQTLCTPECLFRQSYPARMQPPTGAHLALCFLCGLARHPEDVPLSPLSRLPPHL